MAKRQNPKFQKRSKTDRPAFRSDLERLRYAVLLEEVLHPWAMHIIDDLDRDERKVLRLVFTLKKLGYPGLAVADEIACEMVRKITGEKCRLSTFRNGRRKLAKRGLVSRTFWTRPDQRIQNGDRVVVVPGGERVHLEGDKWCTKQIRITLLTPLGFCLIDRASRLESREILARFPTPLKNGASPRIENPLPPSCEGGEGDSKATSIDDVPCQQELSSRLVLSSQGSKSAAPIGLEGNPTCPSSSRSSSSSTGGHGPSTQEPAISTASTKPESKAGGEALSKASIFQRSLSKPLSTGCAEKRPAVPREPRKRRGFAFAKIRLLNILHQCLENYPTPEADQIFARAKVQLELSDLGNWPTVINLPYWLSRAPLLTRRELSGYMRARIIPALRFSGPVVPKESPRYREWTERTPAAAVPRPEDLPPFLRAAAQKWCGQDLNEE